MYFYNKFRIFLFTLREFFAEHLLAQHPGKTVALVESEKTAVIYAGIMPRFLWLATGGKSQINERLLVLKNRKIVAYPDIDGYATWIKKLAQFPDLYVTVSPILQRSRPAWRSQTESP